MSRDNELMRTMQSKAASQLPRPPGIIFPGWFWEEWLVVGAVLAFLVGVVLFCMWLAGGPGGVVLGAACDAAMISVLALAKMAEARGVSLRIPTRIEPGQD